MAEGVPDGLSDGLAETDGVLGLTLTGGNGRPGRGRPSPAGLPAREDDAVGLPEGEASGVPDSSACAGWATSSNEATAMAHRVRSLGVTG